MESTGSQYRDGQNLSFYIQDTKSGRMYRRGKLLGKGAFGRCYKFTDASSRQVFAVKMISHTRKIHKFYRGGVENEIELHCNLKHKNIVRFYHHFEDQKYMYMVLEYCRHKSLAHILRVRKLLTEPEVRYYMKQILQGILCLHQQGIIHRDLKLSNFFIAKNMIVKIGDLGLATTVEQCEKLPGVICGTPNYLSPEVLAKSGHSFKSDIWALGCIMYTMLTGYSPFRARSQKEMYYFIREGFFPVPTFISLSARRLIISLLASCPDNRPCLEEIFANDFLTKGFTPERLSSTMCHTAPNFTFTNHFTRLFRKAANVLYRGVFQKPFCTDCSVRGEDGNSNIMPINTHTRLGNNKGEEPEDSFRSCSESLIVLMKGSMSPRRMSPSHSQTDMTDDRVVEDMTVMLQRCLQNMMPGLLDPNYQVTCPILWVTKWMDYSNKYGFGYQLSDDCVGVLFNDGSHITLNPHLQKVCYSTSSSEHVTFPEWSPPCRMDIKMKILQFFCEYMQEKIMEGGDVRAEPTLTVRTLCLMHFLKTDQALLMIFSNGTLQVNFYLDHTKIILNRTEQNYLLTFIDQERQSCTVPLQFLKNGCPPQITQRMQYGLELLQHLQRT
ncbi:hypothetical protein XENTR_v10001274 [Xenopus tropicalis]|uniref:Serine/threonine-protein kinase PLK n=1 Tax=Xenopus tropicalis TaxID=8364 RepID=F6VBJ2_XENTR|nr:inactive serine/threonine-protein kinase PLK5 [Xenopus tropicalis]KAE8631677.1 hypothetical protein XENTR_v10001274 [Xenopus tropicalis]|eukprot:XP_002941168.2 PREDICTED: inactive serine/threonine-protein kinase PLK5 [Xenopus tropicalis]